MQELSIQAPCVHEVIGLEGKTQSAFERLLAPFAEADAAAIPLPDDPDATCLMIYTSGTTGRPKGAELTHRNLTANLNSLHEAWGWRSDDVLLHVLPLFHVHGLIVALHGALNAGATIVLLTRLSRCKRWSFWCRGPARSSWACRPSTVDWWRRPARNDTAAAYASCHLWLRPAA